MNHKTSLFVYTHWQSFVKEDYHILSEEFKVKKLRFHLNKSPFSFFKGQILGVLQLLWQVPRHEISYIWFADYHAFWTVLLSRFFGKKSVIVVGGFDAVKIPSINYGLFLNKGLRVRMAKFAYRYCDKIVAVDASLIKGKNTFAGQGAISGIAHFVDDIENKSMVIPTGYDDEKWKSLPKIPQVLTVALIKDQKVFDRKGIKLFLEVAQRLPEIPFYLVGLKDLSLIPDELKNLPNLTIDPILPQEELIELYANSKVYVQFSVSEGLPNVLCEAMMSGCVPVGSSANGIPLAIGDCGFILRENNIESAVNLVNEALKSSQKKSSCARERIQTLFPKSLRKEKLMQLIQSL